MRATFVDFKFGQDAAWVNRHASFYGKILTGVPTTVISNKDSISSLYILMHPFDAAVPIDAGLFVPWIP